MALRVAEGRQVAEVTLRLRTSSIFASGPGFVAGSSDLPGVGLRQSTMVSGRLALPLEVPTARFFNFMPAPGLSAATFC